LKRADRSGARYVLMVETPTQAAVKDLRGNEGQQTLAYADVGGFLAARLGSAPAAADILTRVEN
jgi:hypothetical protein